MLSFFICNIPFGSGSERKPRIDRRGLFECGLFVGGGRNAVQVLYAGQDHVGLGTLDSGDPLDAVHQMFQGRCVSGGDLQNVVVFTGNVMTFQNFVFGTDEVRNSLVW